jgi:hypothetical protein
MAHKLDYDESEERFVEVARAVAKAPVPLASEMRPNRKRLEKPR